MKLKIGDKVMSISNRNLYKKGRIYTVTNMKRCGSEGSTSDPNCTDCPGYIEIDNNELGCCCYGYSDGYMFAKHIATWKGRLQ